MSRRVYVHDFLDICGNYIQVEEEKDLKEIEWLVKENEHNIEKLNEENKKRLQPPMRDPIKKRG